MKKLLCILLSLTFILSLTACGNKRTTNTDGSSTPTESKPVKEQELALDETQYVLPEGVEATIIKESIDNSHAVINVVNTSDTTINVPVEYKLLKKVDEQWFEVKPKSDVEWSITLYEVAPNTAKKITVSFLVAHNPLGSGTYRVIRPVYVTDDKSIYHLDCEFTIE